jgi:hypothetical protein
MGARCPWSFFSHLDVKAKDSCKVAYVICRSFFKKEYKNMAKYEKRFKGDFNILISKAKLIYTLFLIFP